MTEAIVHRNAGGNIRHALRDILILDTLVKLDEIAVIHHTDYGTLRFTDGQLRAALKGRVGESHWPEIDKMEFRRLRVSKLPHSIYLFLFNVAYAVDQLVPTVSLKA